MKNISRLLLLSGMVFLLAGCAGYSGFVNSFAPEREKSAITVAAPSKPSGKSPFCAAPPIREVYMVMPEEGGKAGTVNVTFNNGQAVELHGDYSALSLAGDDKKTYVADQEQMRNTFGEAISALPKAPIFATLYFLFGKDELIPESKADAEKIYNDFVQRQAPQVLLIGHTDTVGSAADNERLSIRRAEKVRQTLIQLGVSAENIQAAGHGERELLIATPDNTNEPKNRRVEISVR